MIIHSPVPYLRKTIVLFGLVIVAVGAGISGWRWLTEPPANIVLTNGTALTWVPCWFEVPLLKTMHCAYFYPPPDKKRGVVRLPVVVVRNRLFVHDDDPVLYIAGGPGGSSWLEEENIDFWLQWIERNEWPHDLVLYDQRGTGLSEPKASCPELIDTARRALAQNLTLEQEYAKAMATARRCHRRLSAEGGQLAMYSTDTNARDVHELMGALGHAQWNLYGVSYGSRVTMEVIRRYPETIRSVVLDSVYPPSVDAILKWPALVNNALEGLFRQCRLDQDCSGLMPNPRASFTRALARLRREPARLEVTSWYGEESIKVVINSHRFLYAVFIGLYDRQLIESLPFYIDSASQGRYTAIKPLIEYYANMVLDESLNDVVYYAVECHDSSRFDRAAYLAEANKYPLVARYVRHDWASDICQFWTRRHAPRAFRAPVRSAIPTLLLSGGLDPITPAEWAKQAASHLSRSHHVSFPAVGHGVVDSDDCAPEVVRTFLASPEKVPAAGCLKNLPKVRFTQW